MSQSVLSQDEVDALMRGMGGASEADAPEHSDGKQDPVRDYDLASQERIVRGRMPTLEIINERFSRNLRIGLFNLLRKTPDISVGTVQVQKYGAFLRQLVVPTNFNVVSMQPLRGSGLIVCDPTLVFAVIDALFGGRGSFHTRIEGREFSATEQRVIRRLVEVIETEYQKAWNGVYPLHMHYQRSEMQPQFANIAAPSEIVVSASFTLEINDATGDIHICIPYATLEPIRDVLYSNTQGDGAESDDRWVKLLKHQIQDAQVTLSAELGHAPLTVRDLMTLKAGDFVELTLNKQIEAKIDGVPIFRGHSGVSAGKYALKVEKMLTGSKLNWLGEKHV